MVVINIEIENYDDLQIKKATRTKKKITKKLDTLIFSNTKCRTWKIIKLKPV
jgi:hypothetical protein